MIKSKPCEVYGCSNPRFAKGYCKSHQYLRTDAKKPKKLKKISEKGKEKRVLKKELVKTDMAFYFKLWMNNPHVCTFCQKDLGDKPKLYYFDHILEKQAFPKLRHEADNIQFLCLGCHNNKTNGKVPLWFEKEKARLKEKYKDTLIEIPKQEDSEVLDPGLQSTVDLQPM